MNIWSEEIKDLVLIYKSLKGSLPDLEKELERLIKSSDENMLLVYSRRCLEVIITHLCEKELKRDRGTEPLQRIIDKLNKEKIVPHNIIVSMQNVNSMSTFGAHPKEFELIQLKPVLLNLTTIIEWYISYSNAGKILLSTSESLKEKQIAFANKKSRFKTSTKTKWLAVGSLTLISVIFAILIVFKVLRVDTLFQKTSIDAIVILPFQNLTGDARMNNMLSGMQSMLIEDVQRVGDLRIPSWTSSNAFKNSNLTLEKISSELNTNGAMETMVTCFGDSICILFQLFSTTRNEKQIWEKEYKVAKGEINKLNNQLTKDVAEQLNVKLSLSEQELLAEWKNVDPEAVEFYLEGRHYLDQISRESLPKAKECFEKAIGIDQEWAAPYAGLASVGSYQNQMGFVPSEQALELIRPNLATALRLDPNSSISHSLNAGIAVWTDWNWGKGEIEYKKALEINPNDALSRMFYSHLLMILKRHDEALFQADLALKNDPARPFVMGLYGVVMRVYSKYDLALTQLEKAHALEPNHPFVINNLCTLYRHIGKYDNWFELWKKLSDLDAESIASIENAFRKSGYHAAVQEMINVYEKTESEGGHVPVMTLGNYYNQLGMYEKAIDFWEKAYELHNPNVPYLSMYTVKNKALNDHPRYVELINKMNLPLSGTD